MKKIILILFIFLGLITDVKADKAPEYVDSGLTINNKSIWFGFALPSNTSNNICIDLDNSEKQCLFSCSLCDIGLFQKTDNQYMLPVDNKGIFYFEDEFNLKYYNLESKNTVDVSDDIYKLLLQYQIDPDMSYYIMDDRRFSTFTNKNLSPDGKQFIVEIEYTDEPTMTVRTTLICLVNMDKITAETRDYLVCPIITERMRNIDVAKIPANIWTEKDQPILKEWTDNNTIKIQTEEGDDFVLNVSQNNLQKLIRKNFFPDIPLTHPLYGLTKFAKEQGWISGYPDGTFKPDKTVNRAEFAKMLTLAFSKGTGSGSNLEKFPDIRVGEWYIPYLSKAVELGMMAGYPDGTMKPANTINKAEALKMTLETVGEKVDAQKEGQPWYEKYRLYAAEHYNLDFTSLEDMGSAMTRAECIELIIEAME